MTDVSCADELEQFKTQINLCAYAASRGFQPVPNQSSRRSIVLRNPSGDKLIVSRGPNGHWRYFNVHESRDRGTIVDFIQFRERLSLGLVRRELRQWLGNAPNLAQPFSHTFPELRSQAHDLAQVLLAWEHALPIGRVNNYLQVERKIPPAIVGDARFRGQLRIGERRNVLFAHRQYDDLCGFEVKNRGFTGFAPGGVKGLFSSLPTPNDRELVICETAIDALSYAALHGVHRKRFLSTAGKLSPLQKQLLQAVVLEMPSGSQIILAMDHDAGGEQLIAAITQTLSGVDLGDKAFASHVPDQADCDWNDVLRWSLRTSVPGPTVG